MAMTFAKGELLALCFEFLFFGIFSVLAVITITVLLRIEDPQATRSAKILPAGLVLMLCVAFTHIFLSATGVFRALFSPEGADVFYVTEKNTLFFVRGAMMNFQVILGDCINVWRLWVISDRRRLPILAPMLGILAYIITAVTGCFYAGVDAFDFGNAWIIACAGLTLYVNVHCTVVISSKIYLARTTHAISLSTHPAVMAIIESGALWTAAVIAFMLTYSLSSLGVLVVIDAIVPYVGIVFCLVILQMRYLRYKRTLKSQTIQDLQLPADVSHCSTALLHSPSLARSTPALSGHTLPLTVHPTKGMELYYKDL